MYRPSLLVIVMAAILAGAAPRIATAAHATPSPKASSSPAFSNKIHKPTGPSSRVSAADCNRRGVANTPAGGQLGPNGASNSQTLIAVPIGGGSAAAATRQQQISEACAHLRH